MKKNVALLGLAILVVSLLAIGLKRETPVWDSFKNPETAKMLKQFTALKEAQARAATNALPAEINSLFKAANRGEWLSLSNAFWQIGERNGNFYHPPKVHGRIWTAVEQFVTDLRDKIGWKKVVYEDRLRGTPWEAVKEVWGAFDNFIIGDEKYSTEFGREIIDSIPAGSIYFGGTDPGRFIVTAMCKSQPQGDPFFVLTQNALADGTYLDYLRSMYGIKIYIPTPTDSSDCFQEYARSKTTGTAGSTITISGQVDVMNINGLIVKTVFDHETNREFFIEESFPLDWMYPYLEPHGLIFKLNWQPLTELSEEIIQRDHDYWRKSLEPKIGGWLTNETSVETVAAFAKKIFLQRDLAGFTGDVRFVQNDYTCKMFSKERSSIAGLYAWREQNTTNAGEKKRMNDAADFAFRQALAICPYSPEVVFRYVNLLLREHREADALLIAETASKFPSTLGSDVAQFENLANQLKQYQHNK